MQAFPSVSRNSGRHSVGIVEAHPLPARHTLTPAQDSTERPSETISIIDAQPLPAQRITQPVSGADKPYATEHSTQSVGIAEAQPLPARHENPGAPDSRADKVSSHPT